MSRTHRTLGLVTLLLVASATARAQSAPSAFGHWAGAIKIPNQDLAIEVDLAKNAKGEIIGTFSNPAQHLKGLPLAEVAVDGASVRLLLTSNSGGTFTGVVSDDGTSIAGTFTTTQGGHVLPFTINRTGDATIEPLPRSEMIGKDLEGAWSATVDVEGRQLRLLLTMANRPDGTSGGTLLTLNGGGVEIPIAITQKGNAVTVDVRIVSGSWTGTLSADRGELAGTWTQGPVTLPMTFRRAAEGLKQEAGSRKTEAGR